MQKNRKFVKRLLACMLSVSFCLYGGSTSAQKKVEDNYNLDNIIVYGQRESKVYTGGHVVRQNSLGALGNTDFMDVPFNVLSVSRKSIDQVKQPGNTLTQVLTTDPTVVSRGNKTYNDVRIRGFAISPHDFFLNGVSGMLSQSSIPMNFVERVEIVSGPDTLLNGVSANGTTGGSVNLISKVAQDKQKTTLTQTFSGKSNYEHAIDFGMRFGANKALGVRANLDMAYGNTEFHHEKMSRHNIFINTDYKNDKTRLELLYGYRYVNQNAPTFSLGLNGYKLPAPPKGDANFQLPWSRYRYNNNILTFKLDHVLNKNLNVFFNAGYHDEDWNSCYESYYPYLVDDKGNFKAEMEEVPIAFWRLSFATGLRGTLQTKNINHNFVLRADRLSDNGGGKDWFGEDKDGNVPSFNGNIYDNSIADNKTPLPPILGSWYYSGARILSGITVIDRMVTTDEKYSFLIGGRYQKVKIFKGHDGKDYKVANSTSAFSPNFGIMYTMNRNSKFYFNYMEGLGQGMLVRDKNAVNRGEYLKPQKTKQLEAGIKFDTKKLAGSFSIFGVEQANPYLDAKKVYGYHGRQKNHGTQMTLFGEVTPKWHLLGGVMYMKSTQSGGVKDGKEIAGIPNWNVAMTAEYVADENWSFITRYLYNGATYLSTMKNTDKVPEWYRIDAGIQYQKPLQNGNLMRASVNVLNIFDRRYWVSRGEGAVALDVPRSIVLSVGYDF